MHSACRTGIDAHAAADTLGVVGRFRHVHVHLADLCAFAAGDAFIVIHLHLEEGNLIEQRVERAQRAQPLAKRPVEQYAQHDHRQQDAELPGEKLAERRPDAGVGKREGDRPLQHTLRAEILAEEGVAHAHVVHHQYRQQNDHHQQNCVFQISQGFELLCGKLFHGDIVQQLLQPAEGAEKTADEAPQQNAQQNEKARDIIGKAEL